MTERALFDGPAADAPADPESRPARPPGAIYALLAAVRRDIPPVARRKGEGCPYPVLSAEDIVAAAWPALDRHGVLVIPNVTDVHGEAVQVRRKDQTEITARRASVRAAYRFVAAEDGSWVESVVAGEAVDEGDSALAQALTVAWKAVLVQVLAIRTTGSAGRPARGGPPAGQAQAPAGQSDPRGAIWKHVLALVEGDVELGAEWLSWVTTYNGRPGPTRVENLSDKAAAFYAPRLDQKFSRQEYSRFLEARSRRA